MTGRLPAIAFLALFVALFGTGQAPSAKDGKTAKSYRVYVDLNETLRIDLGGKYYFRTSGERRQRAGDAVYQETVLRRMIGERLALVDLEHAQYIFQMTSDAGIDHAIRDSEHRPSSGLAVVSVCTNPIVRVGTDCQNFTVYFFNREDREQMLRRAFEMWLERVR